MRGAYLRVIMGQPDLQIEESIIQKDYKNSRAGRCVWTVWPGTRRRSVYNLEVQQRNDGAPPERAVTTAG